MRNTYYTKEKYVCTHRGAKKEVHNIEIKAFKKNSEPKNQVIKKDNSGADFVRD
jgi:hypothetical protein